MQRRKMDDVEVKDGCCRGEGLVWRGERWMDVER